MAKSNVNVSLVEFQVQGYRSCRNTTFTPHPHLSALIGINGAGKTALLSAIRLLKSGTRTAMQKAEEEKGANPTILTAWFTVGGKRIGLRLAITLGTSSRNVDEVVSIDERWNFQSITGQRGWKAYPTLLVLETRRGTSGSYRLIEHGSPRLLLDSRALSNKAFRLDYKQFRDMDVEKTAIYQEQINRFRNGISYYSASQFTDPTRCPSNFEIDEDGRLTEPYGASRAHLRFLYDLYRLRTSSLSLYETFVEFVSRNQLGLLSRITWKEIELSSTTGEMRSGKIKKTRKRKTLVIPKVQIGRSYMTFNQLSEGTFKTLALIFYIMTDESSCLLIEEPEVCVHHGLLSKIVSTIDAYSTSKQVVFTTHSDQVLDQLTPSNVYVVEMKRSGTVATGLEHWVGTKGRKALHEYLNEAGTLGEYWRAGGLSG